MSAPIAHAANSKHLTVFKSETASREVYSWEVPPRFFQYFGTKVKHLVLGLAGITEYRLSRKALA
jgi:hypothetical protein